ncbi:MAG TPA: cytochrome c oxidase subunit 3 [Anaeromyxobacteraceae bacterium]|jgi:cytochrome c oxidase subunit 3
MRPLPAAGPAPARVIPHPEASHAVTAHLGMVIFLASWAMLFAGLFFAYGLVRSRAAAWPPLDQPALPLALPGANVAVAALGSAALLLAARPLRRGDPRAAARSLAAAALLGAIFLALQARVWTSLWAQGLRPDGGPYASVFYTLTAFHAVHVLVGLGALVVLAWRAWRGSRGSGRPVPARLWTMYWHFVAAVWFLMYLTVYVL